MTLAMKVNPFAVPVVKLQEDRHQRVIDTGVYGVVRHPMYAGFAPMAVGPALWLESYVAALVAVVPIAVLALRRHIGGTIFGTGTERLRILHGSGPLPADPICLVETRAVVSQGRFDLRGDFPGGLGKPIRQRHLKVKLRKTGFY